MKLATVFTLLSLCLASLGLAQDRVGDRTGDRTQRAPEVDPFATPAPMRRAAANGGRGDDIAGVGSLTTDLPPLLVRALLVLRGRPPAALLEVGGALHIVRAGERLHVVREGLDLPLEILDVSAQGVRLRTPDGTLVQVR